MMQIKFENENGEGALEKILPIILAEFVMDTYSEVDEGETFRKESA